jgi:hypothetical protein
LKKGLFGRLFGVIGTSMLLAATLSTSVFAVSVLSTLNATSVEAASGLTISRVWTRNAQNQDTTSFAPGQGIRYMVSVSNASGQAFKAQFTFEAYPGNDNYSPKRIYYYSQNLVPVPVGTTTFYSPSTVPINASRGSYTLYVSVIADYPAPGNLSAERTGLFTVS